MKKDYPPFFFNHRDHALLSIVDQALEEGGKRKRAIFSASLHPHGIMELAASHAGRMAMAVINLLGNIDAEQAEYRLMALRNLRDEVLYSAQTNFRYNTARVLIEMMKEIVRTRENTRRRLMLAHDFRRATTGNPRIVRQFLRRYHLVEIPETLNQATMDHHVHDANTKGRKNPTHLIMDAWIKGLRYLTIVYYNHISPEALRELFNAAAIMNVHIRIGLEYHTPFKDKTISLIWEPSGLLDTDDALDFLQDAQVRSLMEEGRRISAWNTDHVLHLLECWNAGTLPGICRELGIEAEPLEQDKFLEFVGAGQASTLHLAEMIHRQMLPALRTRFQTLKAELAALNTGAEADSLRERMRYLNNLTPEVVLNSWLKDCQEDLPYPNPNLAACREEEDELPDLALLPPAELTARFMSLRAKSSIRLNLADLAPEDVLEILWDCQGRVSHLESFNLKEWQKGKTPHLAEISLLQQALNNPSPLPLKYIIRNFLTQKNREGNERACAKLREILQNLVVLQKHYLRRPLGSRIGTDSTSNSNMRHGMGLLVPETLPRQARRQLSRNRHEGIMRLPVYLEVTPQITFPPSADSIFNAPLRALRALTGWIRLGRRKEMSWVYSEMATFHPEGNVITIGGIGNTTDNGFTGDQGGARDNLSLEYLNNYALNGLKVAFGLIAAMLTFLYTQEWWVLAWFGALIWFAVTALRNILQAVLSGGGFRRSLLRWSDYINVSRVCDSLMYTGFSVPLLELGVRFLLLEKTLSITLATSSMLVFTFMAVINGLYIASHNIYRGFPRAAIIGNLFRSVLAIPCSIFYHHALFLFLHFLQVESPELYLQLGAAIISKAASDTVAGIIEGAADRRNNLRLRRRDYKHTFLQMVETYTRLELAYPEKNILRLLAQPENLLDLTRENNLPLRVAVIASALDLMYFWDYQPQAQLAFKQMIAKMSGEERLILARSQLVLSRVREISQLFVDGLVGDYFSKALSFYLDRNSEYIKAVHALCVPEAREEKGA